ncbi:MAG TPA: phosphate ABC transporter permease PstA [Chitinophagales bacterium]|nr:phosphate ABC transporter permease PstA [Chitinophagales bacterium]
MKSNIEKLVYRRHLRDVVFKTLVQVLTFMAVLPLLFILYYIISKGITSINWDFLTRLPKPVGETGGGILNAIVGSALIIFVASIIAIPFSIMLGIYLSEAQKGALANWARIGIDTLQGVPSIVLGIVVYVWVVKPTGGFSGFSGSIALALMMVPPIAKATEETMKRVPTGLKEASFALGASYYQTITRAILPAAISGILSGTMLSIARVAGETAPLLFTAFGNPYLNANMGKPMSSIPLLIFNYSISPYEEWQKLAWGASFILIAFIFILNMLTKIAEKRWKIQF